MNTCHLKIGIKNKRNKNASMTLDITIVTPPPSLGKWLTIELYQQF